MPVLPRSTGLKEEDFLKRIEWGFKLVVQLW